MVGARVDSWREPWGRNQGQQNRPRSVSPAAPAGQKPLMRLLSFAKEQENMWAQLITSSCALEGQLRALRAEHEVLKLESQALRRCLHRAGVLSAQEVEQELRQCGVDALVEAGAASEPRTAHLVAAAKQSAAALAEVEHAVGARSVPSTTTLRVQSAGVQWHMRAPCVSPGPPSDARVSSGHRVVRPPARTASPQRRGMAPGRPEESERRPVIIGGGGRRPGSSGSLPSAPSAARLRVDDLSPTTPQQAEMQEDDLTTRTLNQVLDPFLDGERTCSTREQQVLLLQRFLKAVPDPLKRWNGPTGPLIAVSRAGRADLARLLLRSSASANDSDAKGVTALHIAVFDGNAELCKVLLNSKADVDAADRHRQTPLFFAPSKEICRLLVERRAEAGVLNRKGQSALHLAGRAGFHDVLSWLSSRVGKPIVELRDHHGNTAQMYVQQALAASLAQAPHGEDQVGATVVEAPAGEPQPSAVHAVGTAQAAHQEFNIFQEPEEYSIATGTNTTPLARHRGEDDCHGSLEQSGEGISAVSFDKIAAAAAPATTWAADGMIDTPVAEPSPAEVERVSTTQTQPNDPQMQELELLKPKMQEQHRLEEVLDECW